MYNLQEGREEKTANRWMRWIYDYERYTEFFWKKSTEESFDYLYETCVDEANRLRLDPPVLPRLQRIPKKLLGDGCQPFNFPDPKSRFRQKYFEFLETAATAIRSRYEQKGFQICIQIERLLLSALNQQCHLDKSVDHQQQSIEPEVNVTGTSGRHAIQKDLDDICKHYKDDLDSRRLVTQLEVLRDVCRDRKINTVRDVCLCLMKYSSVYDELFSEVARLLRLFLVIPATSATAERSFSTMRRLKTYLRSTMTAQRLNSVMVMHAHTDMLDELNDINTVVEFVGRNNRRKDIFGVVS